MSAPSHIAAAAQRCAARIATFEQSFLSEAARAALGPHDDLADFARALNDLLRDEGSYPTGTSLASSLYAAGHTPSGAAAIILADRLGLLVARVIPWRD